MTGKIMFGITNSSIRDANSSGVNDPDCTYCRMTLSRVEIADLSRIWIPLLDNQTKTVDLLDPEQAYDRVNFLSGLTDLPGGSYYYLRLYLASLESDSETLGNWHGESSLVKEISLSGCRITPQRTTILIVDVDGPAAFNQVANPFHQDFEVESVNSYNLDLVLVPYSSPTTEADGFWSSGDLFGFFKDGLLRDTDGNVLGTYILNQTLDAGTYSFKYGILKNITGKFTILTQGFVSNCTAWKGEISYTDNWGNFYPAYTPRYFVKKVIHDDNSFSKIIMVWSNSSEWGWWSSDDIESESYGRFYHYGSLTSSSLGQLEITKRVDVEDMGEVAFGSQLFTVFYTHDWSKWWYEYGTRFTLYQDNKPIERNHQYSY